MINLSRSAVIGVALSCFISGLSAVERYVKFDPADLLGDWRNEKNSVLSVDSMNENYFSGHFTSAMSRAESCVDVPVPFDGVLNGNAVSISISMQDCGSPAVISMSGYITDGVMKNFTIVQLRDRMGNYNWDSTMILKDTFWLDDFALVSEKYSEADENNEDQHDENVGAVTDDTAVDSV